MDFRRTLGKRSRDYQQFQPNKRKSTYTKRYPRNYRYKSRQLYQPTYSFKRRVQFAQITLTPNVVAQNGLIQFKLNDIPQYTDISNLFDSYQITGVKVEFCPTVNVVSAETTGEIPQILTCIDRNTSVALTGVDEVMAYQNCERHSATTYHSRYFRPHYIGNAVGALGNVPVEVNQNWIPTSSYILNHYGLQWACPIFQNTDDVKVEVWVTYYIKCKVVR